MIPLSPQALHFALVALGLTSLVMVLLARPWLRRKSSDGVDARTFNIQVYRDQLAELETDMKEQRLTQEQYDQARLDLERGMIDDLGRPGESVPLPPVGDSSSNAGVWALVLVAVGLPAIALVLYGVLHFSIEAIKPQQAAQTQNPQPQAGAPGAPGAPGAGSADFSPDEMVNRLAARLESNPGDAKGWAMLGRSYIVLERYADSQDAYTKWYELSAGTLTPEDSETLANYAMSFIRSDDEGSNAKGVDLMEKVLALDPKHQNALFHGGMAAFRRGEFRLAAQRWETLQGMLPEGAPIAQPLASAIEEARVRSGDLKVVPEAGEQPAGGEPATGDTAQDPALAPSAANQAG